MSQQQMQETVYWSKKRKDSAGGAAFLSIVLIIGYALTARFIGLVGLTILLLLLAFFWWAVLWKKNPYYTKQEMAPSQPQDDKQFSNRIQEREEQEGKLKQAFHLSTNASPVAKSQQIISAPISVASPQTPHEQGRQQSEQEQQEKARLLLSASLGFLPESKQEDTSAPTAVSKPTTLEERKVVKVMSKLMMKCPECKGTGTLYNDCPHCDGGYPAWNNYPLVVRAQYLAPCHICHGSGRINPHPCNDCGGTGEVIRQAYAPGESIRIPRILFALCVILVSVSLFIGLSNTPSDGTPLVVVNPTLAHTLGVIGIVGLLLLFIVWIWCLYLTYQRHQSGWRTALWFTIFSAAIPVLLYLLINPQYEQEE